MKAGEERAFAVIQEVAALGVYEVYHSIVGASSSSSSGEDTAEKTERNQTAFASASSAESPELSANNPHHVELNVILDLVDGLDELTTPLHFASAQGMGIVVYLLLSLGASPMAADIRGRTAYFLARDKETRDAFRRYRGTADGEHRCEFFRYVF